MSRENWGRETQNFKFFKKVFADVTVKGQSKAEVREIDKKFEQQKRYQVSQSVFSRHKTHSDLRCVSLCQDITDVGVERMKML